MHILFRSISSYNEKLTSFISQISTIREYGNLQSTILTLRSTTPNLKFQTPLVFYLYFLPLPTTFPPVQPRRPVFPLSLLLIDWILKSEIQSWAPRPLDFEYVDSHTSIQSYPFEKDRKRPCFSSQDLHFALISTLPSQGTSIQISRRITIPLSRLSSIEPTIPNLSHRNRIWEA